MLIQDIGVIAGFAKILYIITVMTINGFKIILVIHLVLRGLWAGLVGLSYVFPDGVNKEKIAKSQKDINYDNPDVFVIKIEKICSLLFSFIFSYVPIGASIYIVYIPIILLFIIGLNNKYIGFLVHNSFYNSS